MSGRSETVETLRQHSETIRGFGATALYLFGSAARDELREESDVDLFIDYDPATRFSLFDQMGLQEYLSELLQRKVDLTTRGGLHPLLKQRIEQSSIKVL